MTQMIRPLSTINNNVIYVITADVHTGFNKPKDTVAVRTMELLESDIEKKVMNTVITFAGTVSNYKLLTNHPVTRIGKAIKSMTDKVGEKYVRFFSAGFYAENGVIETRISMKLK